MTLWIKVTNDKYELPLVVADTAEQLAEKVNISVNCIYSSISHAKRKGLNSAYKKVVVDDE